MRLFSLLFVLNNLCLLTSIVSAHKRYATSTRSQNQKPSLARRARGATDTHRKLQIVKINCGMMQTCAPTQYPTTSPSARPSASPTLSPSAVPTVSFAPTRSAQPSASPSSSPTTSPSKAPSTAPSARPTTSPAPSSSPSAAPSKKPSQHPSASPTSTPSAAPTRQPTKSPSTEPSSAPSSSPTRLPSSTPSHSPTKFPTKSPAPSSSPTTSSPTGTPSASPTKSPQPTTTPQPTRNPSGYNTEFINRDGNIEIRSYCRTNIPSNANPVQDQLINFNYLLYTSNDNVNSTIGLFETQIQSIMAETYLDCNFAPGKEFYVYSVSTPNKDVASGAGCSANQTDLEPAAGCTVVNASTTARIFYLPSRRRLLEETITDPAVFLSFNSTLGLIFARDLLTAPNLVNASFLKITNDDTKGGTANALVPAGGNSVNGGVVAGVVIAALAIVALVGLAIMARRRRKGDGERRDRSYEQALDDVSALDDLTLEQEKEKNLVFLANEDESIYTMPLEPQNQKNEIGPSFVPVDFEDSNQRAMRETVQRDLGPRSPSNTRSTRENVSDTVDL